MSRTKLSALLDGILEAGWLAAIVVTPLFFNIYSARVFEPDKLTTLRSIALVMSAVWLIRRAEEWAGHWRDPDRDATERQVTWRTPLVLPTLFTILVYLISTAFSVTPFISFFGSYQRLQGTFTTLSYLVIFFVILDRMRTRDQVDRFITTFILNSLPIALYGFVQRSQRDPLPWGGDVTRRIASNMGNAIFVAAYLIMATPLTLSRIASAFRAILTDEDTGVGDVLRASAYIFIALVQVIAVYYTKSRGPLMGLLAGVGLWIVLGLLSMQRAAHQAGKPAPSPVQLPNDVGKWLARAAASIELAAILGGLLFFILQATAPTGSTLPLTVGGIVAAVVLAAVWLAIALHHQGRGGTGLANLTCLFEDVGRGMGFFLLGVGATGAVAAVLYALSQGVAALNAALTLSVTPLTLIYIVLTVALAGVGIWLAAFREKKWAWALTGAALIPVVALADRLLGPQVDVSMWLPAIGGLLAYVGTWLVFIVNRWGWRWMWTSVMLLVILFSAGFFAINPGGPLHEWAVENPAIGRLANVLEAESGTGKVRALIWEGALDLIMPHAPIETPPTLSSETWQPDPFNAIRFLVGYGPESMYVAYNGFYPPLLGHFESRTASPDRSHNETLDAVIITGVLGLAAYLWTFGSAFYLGLRWLGFLPKGWRTVLFLALIVILAIVATVVTSLILAPHFFGLAIPVGIVAGVFVYLIVYAISLYWMPVKESAAAHPHAFLLMALLSTFVAHFVEINFGIAIASTRTMFWSLAGVFVILGLQQIVEREEAPKAAPPPVPSGKRRRPPKKEQPAPASRTARQAMPEWLWPALGAALIGALILGTLTYDFVNNVEQIDTAWSIFWRSLTVIAIPANQEPRASLGILMVFTFTWLMTGLLSVTQMAKRGVFRERPSDVWSALLIVLPVSLGVGTFFGLILAGRHATIIALRDRMQTVEDVIGLSRHIAGQVDAYYVFLVAIALLGGLALMGGKKTRTKEWGTPVGWMALLVAAASWLVYALIGASADAATGFRITQLGVPFLVGGGIAAIIGAVVYGLVPNLKAPVANAGWAWAFGMSGALMLFLAPTLSYEYNLRPIHADIIYKQADPWDRSQQWHVAVPHYETAIELAPREDFYYLYLGRAFLEYASALEAVDQQDLAMRETERVLLNAQDINPLNTDHSANLARMYRRWADLPAGQGNRALLGEMSSQYYESATSLSPNNPILWNEWATLCYEVLGDEALYQSRIEHSLELDPEFDQTWLIISDISVNQGDLEAAAEGYQRALEISANQPRVWSALGRVHLQIGNYEEAAAALSEALARAPNASDAWENHYWLAYAYAQTGDLEQALAEGEAALLIAPEAQVQRVSDLLAQLQATISITETTP
ncbi:MAG: tetratricopeptide repeat protein [Anaerolineae bacterium]|nr:tetratricopeptide repeat protein [Anaerolineae bacterium]